MELEVSRCRGSISIDDVSRDWTVVRVRHPPLADPASRKRTTVDEWTQEMQPRRLGWSTGWIVDHDREVADGEWTIQLLVNDRLLLEKTFLVHKRQPRKE